MNKKKAYVVGTNASTSLSPAIFNYWFEKYSINATYGYKEIKEENFNEEIKIILKEKGLVGLNITMPYKEKVLPFLKSLDPVAKKLGAVNCITKKNNSLHGSNTDGLGFSLALLAKEIEITKNWARSVSKTAIVVGYGGAAKSIIDALKELGFENIFVFNRSFEKIRKASKVFNFFPMKLEDLKRVFNCQPIDIVLPSKLDPDLGPSTKKPSAKFISPDLVINTTPINVLEDMEIRRDRRDISPRTADWVGCDIVYRPRRGTGFLDYFDRHKSIEGIDMLVHQAAPCFKLWFNVDPGIDGIDKGLFGLLYKRLEETK